MGRTVMSDKEAEEESVHIEEGDEEEEECEEAADAESMHEEDAEDYIEKDNLEADGDEAVEEEIQEGSEEEIEQDGEEQDGEEQEVDGDEDEEMVDDNEILEDDVDPEDENEGKEEEEEEVPIKKRAKYIVPSRQDFKSDTRELQERTIIVGPVSLKDVLNVQVLDSIKTAAHVSIRFCKPKKPKEESNDKKESTDKKDNKKEDKKDEKKEDKKEEKKEDKETNDKTNESEKEKMDTSTNEIKENGDESHSEYCEELKGVLEVRFNTVDEAHTFIEEIGVMGDGITVSRVNWEFAKSEEYKALKNIAMQFDAEGISGHRLNRTVALCGLALDLNREKLMEAIPLESEIT